MSGAGSVKKGKRYERRTAVELRKVFADARRGLQYQKRHEAADVEAGPLWVEVKGREVATVTTWLKAEKARAAAKSKRKVTALVQPSRGTGPVLVTLPLKALVQMLRGVEFRRRTRRNGGMEYTYSTDAVKGVKVIAEGAVAVAEKAVAEREWAPLGSKREAKDIADGAWLTVFDADGVPVLRRGSMP